MRPSQKNLQNFTIINLTIIKHGLFIVTISRKGAISEKNNNNHIKSKKTAFYSLKIIFKFISIVCNEK